MIPVSLLAIMTVTRQVLGRTAEMTSEEETEPAAPTGTKVTSLKESVYEIERNMTALIVRAHLLSFGFIGIH